MPWLVSVGEHGKPRPVFEIPFWTRRRANFEANLARTKFGVGFILIPELLSLPGQAGSEHLWATVDRITVREWAKRKTVYG